jgi:GAF domain-containing protein/HAMP domain-containing protein
MKQNRRLASRLTTYFILTAIVPLVVFGIIFGYNFVQYSQQSIQTRQANIVAVGRAYIERYFTSLLGDIRLIAGFAEPSNTEWVSSIETVCKSSSQTYLSLAVINTDGNEIAHLENCKLVATSELKNRSKEEAFFRAKRGETFIGNVSFSQDNQPISIISLLSKSKDGNDVIVIGQVNLGNIWQPLNILDIGDGGYLFVVDHRGNLIGYKDLEIIKQERNLAAMPSVAPILVGQNGVSATTYAGLLSEEVVGTSSSISVSNWGLVLEQPTSQVFKTRNALAITLLAIIIGFAIAATLIALFITRSIVAPVEKLATAANALSAGNWDMRVETQSNDEIGVLSTTFNEMAGRLSETMGTLEKRVAERTKALATVAEISTAASTILETGKLLQEVVDLSKERFEFYHTHIYLLNDAGDTLVLASGAGEPGRKMVAEGRSIPLNREQSLVARAARERKGVTVNDVTVEPDFLPHPLLPDTRSELAVPMLVGENVIGVLDVQSDVVGRFTDADIAIQTTLAAQVASAVQNARSYTEIQHNQALLSEALNISRLANWEYDAEKDLFTFNDQFYSIFHTTVEKVGGYKISSADYARNFVHPEDGGLVGVEIARALEFKGPHFKAAVEHRVIFPNGEIGYMSVSINLERDENGKITRWFGANQDITERKRLEIQNAQRAQHQEALNTITQKIQSTTSIEAALQIAARELGHALGKKSTLVTVDPTALENMPKASSK